MVFPANMVYKPVASIWYMKVEQNWFILGKGRGHLQSFSCRFVLLGEEKGENTNPERCNATSFTDLSVFCLRALQSNSFNLVRCQAVVDFSSNLSPAAIPSVGKQGSRAATIHCHSLSQGPPALWLLISVHFSDLQFPDLQVVKILVKNTGLENVPE